MSPSAPRALKSSKLNEPSVVRGRRGINFGEEQPSGNMVSKAFLPFFGFCIAMLAFRFKLTFYRA